MTHARLNSIPAVAERYCRRCETG